MGTKGKKVPTGSLPEAGNDGAAMVDQNHQHGAYPQRVHVQEAIGTYKIFKVFSKIGKQLCLLLTWGANKKNYTEDSLSKRFQWRSQLRNRWLMLLIALCSVIRGLLYLAQRTN